MSGCAAPGNTGKTTGDRVRNRYRRLSDDNFSPLQGTLLLMFELDG